MKRFLLPLLLLFASPAIADTCLVTSGTPTTVAGQQSQQYCDQSGNLRTTATLSATGTASNAADAQATSTDNAKSLDFPYLYNGSTFDRWRGDATSGAWVNIKNASIPVTGTFWQATQPVSIASMPSTPVTGTFWQATQPVSGTFWQATQPISAAALPLPSGAATSGNQTTANTSLASIDTKMPAAPATAGNQTTANTSLASIDTKTPASPATAGNQTTANTSLASIDTKSGVPRTPATGTGTPTAVTVGASSAQALAAATRTQRLVLQNVSASANIACSLGGTAALNTAGSFQIGPGQLINLGDGLYIPGDAVNCIASVASTPLTAWSR